MIVAKQGKTHLHSTVCCYEMLQNKLIHVPRTSNGSELSFYPDSPPLLDSLIEEFCRHRCWHRSMYLDRTAKKAAASRSPGVQDSNGMPFARCLPVTRARHDA